MDKSAQKAENAAAASEGRAIYVRGIPTDWTQQQLSDFFSHQGAVQGVNLLPPRVGQTARAAFVNFETAEEASSAAEVCDGLPLDDPSGVQYNLVCSLKKGLTEKVSMVSGFSDLSKARQEKRAVYISGLPVGYDPEMVKSLLEQHVPDAVDAVNLLPPSRNLSCFAIMRSPEDAALAISYLDGEAVDGKTLSVTYPRPPKRSRAAEQEPGKGRPKNIGVSCLRKERHHETETKSKTRRSEKQQKQ